MLSAWFCLAEGAYFPDGRPTIPEVWNKGSKGRGAYLAFRHISPPFTHDFSPWLAGPTRRHTGRAPRASTPWGWTAGLTSRPRAEGGHGQQAGAEGIRSSGAARVSLRVNHHPHIQCAQTQGIWGDRVARMSPMVYHHPTHGTGVWGTPDTSRHAYTYFTLLITLNNLPPPPSQPPLPPPPPSFSPQLCSLLL